MNPEYRNIRVNTSKKLYEQASQLIPGGVNSPVRAFKSVGGTPIFMDRGKGAYLYDVDGNQYIDYVGSWGPMILGHAFPPVVQAVQQAALASTSFGTPSSIEVEIASLIIDLVPSVEQVRMVNSGTEATMSAVRLARGVTGRDKIIKFEGHYHGHADYFLIAAGSGATTLGQPNSPGVTTHIAQDTLLAPFNDLEAVKQLVAQYRGEIACIIVEPVAGNMGCVPPASGFLEGLREICDREDVLLIFDEVMTGFRVALGGAQERYGVMPDLTTLGKIIGGGLPVGAYGGKRELMEYVAPAGPVYQAGTLSGNPLAMHAGYATLKYLADHPELYDQLEEYGRALEEGTRQNLERLGIPYYQTRVGAMGSLFFSSQKITDYASARQMDTQAYARYFHAMLDEGVYLAPSPFEAFFFSTAHGEEELQHTLKAQQVALERVIEAQ